VLAGRACLNGHQLQNTIAFMEVFLDAHVSKLKMHNFDTLARHYPNSGFNLTATNINQGIAYKDEKLIARRTHLTGQVSYSCLRCLG
jgi:hypothetical protein